MSKEELLDAICKIDKQLEECKKVYEPFVGRRFDSMSIEEAESIRNFAITIQKLMVARADLRNKVIHEYSIFVMY